MSNSKSNRDRVSSFTKPGGREALAELLTQRVAGAGRKGLSTESLAQEVGLPQGDPLLSEVIGGLRESGKVVEQRDRWVLPEKLGLLVGTLWLQSDGKGRVSVEPRFGEEDEGRPREIPIGRRHVGGARNGDRVLVERARRGRDGSWAVAEILERRSSEIVGRLHREGHAAAWRLVPFDHKLGLDFEIADRGGSAEAGDLEEGLWVVARLVETQKAPAGRSRRPKTATGLPRARIIERLGLIDEPEVDSRVVLRALDIPEAFPEGLERAVEKLPRDPKKGDFAGRQDLRHLPTMTIDGASARDFDDAISITRTKGGGFRLAVHIADVAHYVEEMSPLDREAYRRGTSVYFPERAVPMLPERLSNGLCSLRPNVPRLTLSAILDFDREGNPVGQRFAETVIESDRRLTYSEAKRWIEHGRKNRKDDPLPEEVLTALLDAAELAARLREQRHDRGALDLDLAGGEILVDDDGQMTGIRPAERNVAHRLIEELMIAANEAVADELDERQVPALFRVHESPDPDALEQLATIVAELGLRFDVEAAVREPGALAELLDRLEERSRERREARKERGRQEDEGARDPESEIVSSLILRSLSRARYDPACHGHYALASDYYTHFTSPIRRYPDLVVHRQLKALLDGTVNEGAKDLSLRLPGLAERTSFCERRAEGAERTLAQWKKVRFLADRIGDNFFGRVTGVQPFGLFLQLEEVFTDGLIGVRNLGEDYWIYEADRHRLVGERTGKIFQLGQRLEVTLVGIDELRRGLDLELAGEERRRRREPPRRRKGAKDKKRRPVRRRHIW